MSTGKAAVMVGFNKPFEIREYPLPKELEKGAILVKMVAAGICGTDVHTWMGQTGGKVLNFPVILGHENVGQVIEIGGSEEVKAFDGTPIKKGDLITWPTTIGTYCYDCANCKNGIPNKCLNRKTYGAGISSEIPPHFFGGWAEYCYLFPKTSITILPKNVDPKALVATGCALPTTVHAAERAGINIGDNVVVQGSGAVGLMAAVVARESGANKVVVVGGPEHRLELAKKWGVDETINIYEMKNVEERVKKVKDICGGVGGDVVFECTGFPNAFSEGVQMLRDGGNYVVVGQFMDAGPAENFHPFLVTFKHCNIKGSYSWLPKHTYRAVKLIEKIAKKYELEKLVSHTFPLEKVNEAVLSVKNFEAVRAALVF